MDDAKRLRTLEELRLLDSDPEQAFDRLTRLASRILRAPVALMSLVDDHRQFFKSAIGLAEPWAAKRETPLSHSFCKHVVADRSALVVEDARLHAVLKDNPAIRELSAVAYAGVPLIVDEQAVGAFCVLDDKPHAWSEDDVRVLRDLADCVVSEIELRTALRAIHQSEQIHRAIVRHLPNGAVFVVDRDLRYVTAGGPILGESLRRAGVENLIGKTVQEVAPEQHREETLWIFRNALAGKTVRKEIVRGGRFLEVSAVPVHDESGVVTNALILLYDVTERRREQTLLDATLSNIADGVVLLDAQRNILLSNVAFARMFGFEADKVLGLPRPQFLARIRPLFDEEDYEAFVSRRNAAPDGSEDVVLARPHRRVLHRTETPMSWAEGGFLVTWHDVTTDKALLAERDRQALVDALTGVPNRRAAESTLATRDAQRRRSGRPMSVAMFDVDHFKRVNDTHGHASGDEVLKLVAKTLATQARASDVVARWGGEEFLAILDGPLDGAIVFGERARRAVERLDCPGVGAVTISIGLAEIGQDESPAAAVARADERLYRAKQNGRNRLES